MTIQFQQTEHTFIKQAPEVQTYRQYCESCGRVTTQALEVESEPDGSEWERYTCLECGNSHTVRTS